MEDDIRTFLATWLPRFKQDNRSYVTIAVGCTGGQHRSVYPTDACQAGALRAAPQPIKNVNSSSSQGVTRSR